MSNYYYDPDDHPEEFVVEHRRLMQEKAEEILEYIPLKDRLKPCPFCGELPEHYDDDGVLMVQCLNNQCPLYDLPAMSAESWQKRAVDD